MQMEDSMKAAQKKEGSGPALEIGRLLSPPPSLFLLLLLCKRRNKAVSQEPASGGVLYAPTPLLHLVGPFPDVSYKYGVLHAGPLFLSAVQWWRIDQCGESRQLLSRCFFFVLAVLHLLLPWLLCWSFLLLFPFVFILFSSFFSLFFSLFSFSPSLLLSLLGFTRTCPFLLLLAPSPFTSSVSTFYESCSKLARTFLVPSPVSLPAWLPLSPASEDGGRYPLPYYSECSVPARKSTLAGPTTVLPVLRIRKKTSQGNATRPGHLQT